MDKYSTFIEKIIKKETKLDIDLVKENMFAFKNDIKAPFNINILVERNLYINKNNAKRALKKFTQGLDYIISVENEEKIGKPAEIIMLSSYCFKSLCMMSTKPEGKKIREYYILLEDIYYNYITSRDKKNMEELKKVKKEKSNLISAVEKLTLKIDYANEKRAEEIKISNSRQLLLEQEYKNAEAARQAAEIERKIAAERYKNMCERYNIQDDTLTEITTQLEIQEEQNIGLLEEIKEVKEEVKDVKEEVKEVKKKLKIVSKHSVIKSESKSKLETIIVMKYTQDELKVNNHKYEYKISCGQVKYIDTVRNVHKRKQMYELCTIDYTPNSKNILHRLKDLLRDSCQIIGKPRAPSWFTIRNISETDFINILHRIDNEKNLINL